MVLFNGSLETAHAFEQVYGFGLRSAEMLLSQLAPLQSFDALVNTTRPTSVLEIGCGTAIALLEVASRIGRLLPSAHVCSAGLTLVSYGRMMVHSKHRSLPSAAEARRAGVQAIFEAGVLEPETVEALERRLQIAHQRNAAPPVIIDHNYDDGLPFPANSFGLVFEQVALKWNERLDSANLERDIAAAANVTLLGPAAAHANELNRESIAERIRRAELLGDVPVEEFLRFLLDEVHRVLRIDGSAVLSLLNVGHREWRASPMLEPQLSSPLHTGTLPPAEVAAWLAARRRARMVPLELVVGRVTWSGRDGCFGGACNATCPLDEPVASSRSSCTVGLAYATKERFMLHVRNLENAPSCTDAASRLSFVQALMGAIPGAWQPEGRTASKSIVNTLRMLNRSMPGVDPYVSGVRRWWREPLACHFPAAPAWRNRVDSPCGLGAQRMIWSRLHIYKASL